MWQNHGNGLDYIQFCYPLRSSPGPHPQIHSFGVSFPPSGETLVTSGGFEYWKVITAAGGRGLEASVLLRFCRWVFGLPLQSLLLLIHSHLLIGACGSEFGQEWFLPL